MEVKNKMEREKKKSRMSPGVLVEATRYRVMENWRETGWEHTYAVSTSVLDAKVQVSSRPLSGDTGLAVGQEL